MQDVGGQQQNVVVDVVVGCLYPADNLDQLVAADVGDLRPCRSGGFEREVLDVTRLPVGKEVIGVLVMAGFGVEPGDRCVGRLAALQQPCDGLDGGTQLCDALWSDHRRAELGAQLHPNIVPGPASVLY
ncbi:hypothetical protein [Micromonospora globispora]|uniref:hypothetical protein n=1 Tax=Micromonospora globispora TaxID=1450148 RepID=UPI001C8976D0|nr:hypothetical protein [Micromonospora globispora]